MQEKIATLSILPETYYECIGMCKISINHGLQCAVKLPTASQAYTAFTGD